MSIVDPLDDTLAAMKSIEAGELDTRLPMLSVDELGDLSAGFNHMAAGIEERDFIKDTFGKYVTHQVMEEILNGKLELGGEKREATVLLSDIRGFTALSKKMPPERLVRYLNQYLDVMVDVVFECGGTLDKFIGDAILASFGVPVHADDHAERAAKCALEMIRRLEGLNEQYRSDGEPEINIGVAIATGKVVAGNIGSKKRMEYTVIGETVNTSSRIEALNKKFGTKILVNEEARKKLDQSGFSFRPMPKVSVPGKAGEISVYEMQA